MRDIYWDKLSSFERFIFIFGWFSAMHLFFWLSMLIAYIIKKDKKGYSNFFNPHTLKVPYVFGWINLILILGFIIIFILWLSVLLSVFSAILRI